MVRAKVRVEQIIRTDSIIAYHVVLETPTGQYRNVLEYLGEPLEKDLREDMRAWAKAIKIEREIVESVNMADKDGDV